MGLTQSIRGEGRIHFALFPFSFLCAVVFFKVSLNIRNVVCACVSIAYVLVSVCSSAPPLTTIVGGLRVQLLIINKLSVIDETNGAFCLLNFG